MDQRFKRTWTESPGPLATPCWIWDGKPDAKGYGHVYVPRQVKAHVWMWEQHRGPVPEGHVLDHLCRIRNCVNPDHLEPVTEAENNRRGESMPAKNARKTHCRYGHEFTPENTIVDDAGHRRCRECIRRRNRETQRRIRADAKRFRES